MESCDLQRGKLLHSTLGTALWVGWWSSLHLMKKAGPGGVQPLTLEDSCGYYRMWAAGHQHYEDTVQPAGQQGKWHPLTSTWKNKKAPPHPAPTIQWSESMLSSAEDSKLHKDNRFSDHNLPPGPLFCQNQLHKGHLYSGALRTGKSVSATISYFKEQPSSPIPMAGWPWLSRHLGVWSAPQCGQALFEVPSPLHPSSGQRPQLSGLVPFPSSEGASTQTSGLDRILTIKI